VVADADADQQQAKAGGRDRQRDQEVTLVAILAAEGRVEVAAGDQHRGHDERRAEAGDDAAGDQHALAVARVLILGAPGGLGRAHRTRLVDLGRRRLLGFRLLGFADFLGLGELGVGLFGLGLFALDLFALDLFAFLTAFDT